VLTLAAEDERVELQVVTSLLYHYKSQASALGKGVVEVAPFRELAEAAGDVATETGKPVVFVLPSLKRGLDDLDVLEVLARARAAFLDRGIPVFDDIADALRAVGHLNTYYGRRHG